MPTWGSDWAHEFRNPSVQLKPVKTPVCFSSNTNMCGGTREAYPYREEAFEPVHHLSVIDSMGRCGSASGRKVNGGWLNEAHHCSPQVFDLLAVGQNLSGESRPGPRLQFVSTQEGWEHKAEDVGGGFSFPRLPLCSFISTWPAHRTESEKILNRCSRLLVCSLYLLLQFLFVSW